MGQHGNRKEYGPKNMGMTSVKKMGKKKQARQAAPNAFWKKQVDEYWLEVLKSKKPNGKIRNYPVFIINSESGARYRIGKMSPGGMMRYEKSYDHIFQKSQERWVKEGISELRKIIVVNDVINE